MNTPCESCGSIWGHTRIKKITVLKPGGIRHAINCKDHYIYKCNECGHVSMTADFKVKIEKIIGCELTTPTTISEASK